MDSFLFFLSKGNGDECGKFIFTNHCITKQDRVDYLASIFLLILRRNILQKIKIKNISELLKPLNQQKKDEVEYMAIWKVLDNEERHLKRATS